MIVEQLNDIVHPCVEKNSQHFNLSGGIYRAAMNLDFCRIFIKGLRIT
jgi:hypothetical protein